jgi:hypothetical protein
MALSWGASHCADGESGHWKGLGSDSNLPFDDARIGVGEYEGRSRGLEEAQKDAKERTEVAERTGSAIPIGVQLVGADIDALQSILDRQAPGKRESFAASTTTCQE